VAGSPLSFSAWLYSPTCGFPFVNAGRAGLAPDLLALAAHRLAGRVPMSGETPTAINFTRYIAHQRLRGCRGWRAMPCAQGCASPYRPEACDDDRAHEPLPWAKFPSNFTKAQCWFLRKKRNGRIESRTFEYPCFDYRALLVIARPVAGLFVGTTVNESLAEGAERSNKRAGSLSGSLTRRL
jgi:hypothetical protein